MTHIQCLNSYFFPLKLLCLFHRNLLILTYLSRVYCFLERNITQRRGGLWARMIYCAKRLESNRPLLEFYMQSSYHREWQKLWALLTKWTNTQRVSVSSDSEFILNDQQPFEQGHAEIHEKEVKREIGCPSRTERKGGGKRERGSWRQERGQAMNLKEKSWNYIGIWMKTGLEMLPHILILAQRFLRK